MAISISKITIGKPATGTRLQQPTHSTAKKVINLYLAALCFLSPSSLKSPTTVTSNVAQRDSDQSTEHTIPKAKHCVLRGLVQHRFIDHPTAPRHDDR